MRALALLALLSFPALGHESCNPDNGLCQQYDAACCNEQDCRPIPQSAVEETGYGFRVTYGGHVYDIKRGAHLIATDGRYHLCVYEDPHDEKNQYVPEERPGLMCFYVPGAGV